MFLPRCIECRADYGHYVSQSVRQTKSVRRSGVILVYWGDLDTIKLYVFTGLH